MTAEVARRTGIDIEDPRSVPGRPATTCTIGDLLDRVAREMPDHEALVSYPALRRCTYGELQAQVDRCARGLLACGVRRLDRVGTWSLDDAEGVVAHLAAAKIGAVLVCLDPAWDNSQVATVLRESHVSLLIVGPSRRTDNLAGLARICPEVRSSPRGQIRARLLPALHTIVALGVGRPSGVYHWRDLLALGDEVSPQTLRARQAASHIDDPVTLPYVWTVGGGIVRHAVGTQYSLLAAAACLAELLTLTPKDRLCLAVPCSQHDGLEVARLACLASGATIVLPAADLDPPSLLETVQEARCTQIYATPALFGALLAHPAVAQYDLSTLRPDRLAPTARG